MVEVKAGSQGSGFMNADAATCVNAMTVDVEDYFQVSAMEPYVSRGDWHRIPCRVERNTDRILDLFASVGIRATFFTLGWVAEKYPELVRRINAAGHEVASHGMQHTRVTQQKPREFREDIRRCKRLLEDTVGSEIAGYRAASYSIGRSNLWALDILGEEGYRYSSSIYPIHHDLYGMPEAPRFPFRPTSHDFLEIPVTTIRIGNRNLPCGGGGYFRLLPYGVSRWAMRRVNTRDSQPCVFYFHPWEIDPEQPRQNDLNMKTKFRHYINLHRMEKRLSRLLNDFKWDRMDAVYANNMSYPVWNRP